MVITLPRVVEFPTLKFAFFCIVVLTVSWLIVSWPVHDALTALANAMGRVALAVSRKNRFLGAPWRWLAWLIQPRSIQKVILLLASYWFAWKFKWEFLVVLIASSVMNFAIGRTLTALRGKKGAKTVLTLGVLANLGVLGYYKYYSFFVDSVAEFAAFLGLEAHLPILEVIAPFGISFFTFQGMSYIIDTYRGKAVQPETLLDFSLFIAFFPQFGAGPICRSNQLLPQIHAPAPPGVPHVSEAAALIMTGLFKKMVLATFVASHLTTEAFDSPSKYSSVELVLAVYSYTAQVYLDFSGYTDLARGIGLLFGFDLPENFNYPYAATNIGDFWRRWHMTFSTWLREYIYFPLGGSRIGRWRTYFNLMVTFTACGIWHGASWGFVIWGAIHGVGLSVYKASLDIRRDMGINTDGPKPWYWDFAGWFATLSFCAFARIFFKAPTLTIANEFWAKLFEFSWAGRGFDVGVALVFALTIFMNFYGRASFNLLVRLNEATPRPARPFAWISAMLVLFTLKPAGMAATIYFRF